MLPYMAATCQCPSAERNKTGRQPLDFFFSFFPLWPFKSTLQPTLLWPLMYAVHLARQSCETQDHRHGLKQFHPLIEPISSSHRKKGNQVRLTVKYSRSKLKKKKTCNKFVSVFSFFKKPRHRSIFFHFLFSLSWNLIGLSSL